MNEIVRLYVMKLNCFFFICYSFFPNDACDLCTKRLLVMCHVITKAIIITHMYVV